MRADFEEAAAKAAEVLKKYKIVKPPIDPELIAENMGIGVVYANFQSEISEKISGLIRFNEEKNDAALIIVNKAIAANRLTFTIAHELAHYVLHRDDAESNEY